MGLGISEGEKRGHVGAHLTVPCHFLFGLKDWGELECTADYACPWEYMQGRRKYGLDILGDQSKVILGVGFIR